MNREIASSKAMPSPRLGLGLALVVPAFFLGRIVAQALAGHATPTTLAADLGPEKDPGADHSAAAAAGAPAVDAHKLRALEEAVVGQMAHLGSQAQFDTLLDELATLAASDPRRAMELARQQLKPPFLDQALAKILARWVETDPAAAWVWAKQNPGEDHVFPDQVLNQVAMTQPDLAWSFAAELAAKAPEESPGFYVSALRGMLYAGNFQAAARLLGSAQLPQKSLDANYGLPGFIASSWAAADPEAAGQWVLSLPGAGNARQQAITGLAQAWPQVDPQGAVNFATQLPASASRLALLTAGVSEWYARDPAQVNAWASAIPHDGDYDQFAAAISSAPNLVSTSPPDSIAWAESISNPELEVQSLAQIFNHWIQMSDTPALAYLQNAKAFPPAIRALLLHRLGLNMP
ncbi:MAG: hypothetical protein QM796_17060 [Chthoniobacteraceae bacterium]